MDQAVSAPTHLDLFSGVGGFSLAFERAGFETLAFSEIEPFPCSVLAQRFPGVPNLGDISEITATQLEALGEIDVVTFGSPCQDWSVAGKRMGMKGHRSSLFHEAIRVIRIVRPRYGVFENVPGLFSSAYGWDFASVLDEMAESGALDIAWSVLDAQWFGVPQRRRRIFLVADFGGERAGEILSIAEGVCRDLEKSREEGQEAANGTGDGFAFALRGRDEGARVEVSGNRTSSIRGEGGSGRDYIAEPSVASTLGGGSGNRGWADDTDRMTFVPERRDDPALTSKMAKGTGGPSGDECQNLVTEPVEPDGFYSNQGYKEDPVIDNAPPLKESQHTTAVAFPIQDGREIDKRQNGLGVGKEGDPAYTLDSLNTQAVAFAENQRAELRVDIGDPQLTTGGGKPGQGYPTVALPYMLKTHNLHNDEKGDVWTSPLPHALDTTGDTSNQMQAVHAGMAVRRLTPLECERLQGFPDGWTDIPGASDSARYRAMGNAVAVPVVEWIAHRLRKEIE
jgi:DNA (cytosine-5)-methyltransferase 1